MLGLRNQPGCVKITHRSQLISSDRKEESFMSTPAQQQPSPQLFFQTINAPFVGDDLTRWVDGQFALRKPELGLSNWERGRLFGRGGILAGDSVYTVRTRSRLNR